MKLVRLLRTRLRPYRGALTLVIVLQLLQAIAMLTLPGLSADLIDNGVLVGDNRHIWRMGGFMLAVTLVQAALSVAAVYFGARVAMGFSRDVRRDLFHQVTNFSAREVAEFGAPSLITRITNDVQQVQMLVVLTSTMMLAAPLTMVVGVVMAIRQDVGLSIIMVVAVPATVVLLGLLVSRMVPAFRLMQVRVDRINSVLRDQITGIRVVRAFVREPEERARFEQANADVTEVSLRAGHVMAFMIPSINLIVGLANVAVLALGAPRIESGDLQVGSLVAYLSYLLQVLLAVVMTTFVASMIPRASVAADRIVDVLDTSSSVVPPTNPVTAMPEPGSIRLDDVAFQYPGAAEPVLCYVTFDVGPGTTTAIIGSTGSGKTTLVNVMMRMFDATEGEVIINGVPIRDLDLDTLWTSIGYVPQKAFLFSGTVASNLRYGRPDATDDELWAALTVAQATDFVQSMPDGLDSEIAQGGSNVSGGQRQRLSIARALVARPSIYIFDDSFSALDLATEARLRGALTPYTADAAVVTIAQRVSSIRDADQIVVLENGRVVGLGRHDELVESCPTYIEIVDSQHAGAAT